MTERLHTHHADDATLAHLARQEEEIGRLRAENARLRQLLIEYGRHNDGCSAAFGVKYRCRCGWRDVEPEFK